MTPAINSAKHAGFAFQLHEYEHDATAHSYGLEAAEKLGVAVEQVVDQLVPGKAGHVVRRLALGGLGHGPEMPPLRILGLAPFRPDKAG